MQQIIHLGDASLLFCLVEYCPQLFCCLLKQKKMIGFN